MAQKSVLTDLLSDSDEGRAALTYVELVKQAGALMKAMREAAHLSVGEMASRLGLSTGRISQLESGQLRHAPNLRNLAHYAIQCGVDLQICAKSELGELDIGEPSGEEVLDFDIELGEAAFTGETVASSVTFGRASARRRSRRGGPEIDFSEIGSAGAEEEGAASSDEKDFTPSNVALKQSD